MAELVRGATITTPTTPDTPPPGRPHLQEETRRCLTLEDVTLMHCTILVRLIFLAILYHTTTFQRLLAVSGSNPLFCSFILILQFHY